MRQSATTTAARGRIDKRQAILGAAFTVFARRGYTEATVKEIADEAGVAKLTVYNHLTDKENLFRQALQAAASLVSDDNLAVVDRLRDPGDDLRATLEDVAHRLLKVCCGERSQALRRLTFAHATEFADLMDLIRSQTGGRLQEALADRLARLSLAGTVRQCEPSLAAEQFLVLLTGSAENRSRPGTRKLPAPELRRIAHETVDTWWRAYAPESCT